MRRVRSDGRSIQSRVVSEKNRHLKFPYPKDKPKPFLKVEDLKVQYLTLLLEFKSAYSWSTQSLLWHSTYP